VPVIQISARNQLQGTITAITLETVMVQVTIDLGHGNEIVAAITVDSFERLGVEVGSEAIAVIKTTEVMAATQ
jgi:molybdate transport system regulatory protein